MRPSLRKGEHRPPPEADPKADPKAIALDALPRPRFAPSREWMGPPHVTAAEPAFQARRARKRRAQRQPTTPAAVEAALRAAGLPVRPDPVAAAAMSDDASMAQLLPLPAYAGERRLRVTSRATLPVPGVATDARHGAARAVTVQRIVERGAAALVGDGDEQERVPATQLLLTEEEADSPAAFAAWVADAYRRREAAAGLLRFELYVDCMPVDPAAERQARARQPALLARLGARSRWRRVRGVFAQAQFAEAAAAYVRAFNAVALRQSAGQAEADVRLAGFRLPVPVPLPLPAPCSVPPVPGERERPDPVQAHPPALRVLQLAVDFGHSLAQRRVEFGLGAVFERRVAAFHHRTLDDMRVLVAAARRALDASPEWAAWRGCESYDEYARTPLRRLCRLLQAVLADAAARAGAAALADFVAAARRSPRPLLTLVLQEDGTLAGEAVGALLGAFDALWETFGRVTRLEPLLLRRLFLPRSSVVPTASGVVAGLRAELEQWARASLEAPRAVARALGAQVPPPASTPAGSSNEALLRRGRARLAERAALARDFPLEVREGAWALDARAARQTALDRHREAAHACGEAVAARIDDEARELGALLAGLDAQLQTYPRTLDHLAAIERSTVVEVAADLAAAVARLRAAAAFQAQLLDDLRLPLAYERKAALWGCFEQAAVVARDLSQLETQLRREKERFGSEAAVEQRIFEQALGQLEETAGAFAADAAGAALGAEAALTARLREIEAAVAALERQVRLLNAHESLVGRSRTELSGVARVRALLRPHKLLWEAAALFAERHAAWMAGWPPADEVEGVLDGVLASLAEAGYVLDESVPLRTLQQQARDLRQHVPLLRALQSPHMRARHWDALGERLGFAVSGAETWAVVFELGLPRHADLVLRAADVAATEAHCDALLHEIDEWWGGCLVSLRDVGRFGFSSGHAAVDEEWAGRALARAEADREALGRHRVGGVRHHHFARQVEAAFQRAVTVAAVLRAWLRAQTLWLGLHQRFANEEIDAPPAAVTRFARVEQEWRRLAHAVDGRPAVVMCDDQRLLRQLEEMERGLEAVGSVVYEVDD